MVVLEVVTEVLDGALEPVVESPLVVTVAEVVVVWVVMGPLKLPEVAVPEPLGSEQPVL